MRIRITYPNKESEERTISKRVIRLGRSPDCEVLFDPDTMRMISGEHARLEQTADGCVLVHLSSTNPTFCNDRDVQGRVPVKVGDLIRLGRSGPEIEILALPPLKTPSTGGGSHPAAIPGATVQAGPQHLALLRGSADAERMPIGRGGIIGRPGGEAKFVLDHPHVSRQHARLVVKEDSVVLQDLGSANGTFVNGKRIAKRVTLSEGDRIDIGPFALEFDGEALASRSRSNNIELVGRDIKRVVTDRMTGKPLTLLHDINLVVRPREFVCLLGPSGSGKSTLLTLLSGRTTPTEGTVTVNGSDLHANFGALKQDLAVVPQKDILHDTLAVGTALRYTAELRLPPDTSRDEIESSVGDILNVVGLTKKRGTLIRDLSGGQVKRASLANELMARPSLLFLDEVTSGLDEQTDRDMMELFREVADSGKTVVCITHSLANVEATCHLVVILTEGGRLAFVGTPEEARTYFKIPRLGEVYRKLAERTPKEWQEAFEDTALFDRYVRDRLPPEENEDDEETPEADDRTAVNPLRQTWTLTRRSFAIWRGDPVALLTILGQCLLVGLLLGIMFGRLDDVGNPIERASKTVSLLFLANVSCFWFGCNSAAKELVKERTIYSRERDFNLRIDSYYASKVIVLVVIVLLQVTLLFAIIKLWCDPPGSALGEWLSLIPVAIAGTTLGLLLSASARTEDVAVSLVPIAVIPQIVLAGVIAPLNGVAKWLARIAISSHWGQRLLESRLPETDLQLTGRTLEDAWRPLSVLGAHILVFVVATLALLIRQGRRRG
jgi:ABC-type multidrug transport system ATPase subunit